MNLYGQEPVHFCCFHVKSEDGIRWVEQGEGKTVKTTVQRWRASDSESDKGVGLFVCPQGTGYPVVERKNKRGIDFSTTVRDRDLLTLVAEEEGRQSGESSHGSPLT